MPFDLSAIDLTAVNWLYVAILCLFAFVAALLGSLIMFRNRFAGAIVAGILFGAAYVYWTYYPHPQIPGPIGPGATAAAASAAPAPMAPAVRPANPVTTITPEPSPPPATAPPASAPPASAPPAPAAPAGTR